MPEAAFRFVGPLTPLLCPLCRRVVVVLFRELFHHDDTTARSDGTFTPAYFADKHGRPMHSWRVLILPYFEAPTETQAIYNEYNFNEPWDGPNKRRLIARMPELFRCPYARDDRAVPTGTTNYVAVVGDHTAWPSAVGRSMAEIADGLNNTIMFVETTGRGIAWTEPGDLDFDCLDFAINSSSGYGVASGRPDGETVLISDGSVRVLPQSANSTLLRSWLTVDGGEPVSWP